MKKLLIVLFLLCSINPALADSYNFQAQGGGGGGAVDSVSNSDGTITISPTTNNVVVSLSPLTSAHILVGNGSNKATDVAASGDLGLSNTGVFTLGTVNSNVGTFASPSSVTVNGKGLITAITAGSGGGSVLPATNNFRLTLTTLTPITTNDVTAATTIYSTPYTGTHISTYDASVWTDHTSAEISLAVPASLHRIYDVFAYYTGGALTLTTTAWDSGGQTTGTVTAATAASPSVITATNTLSNGDLVFIDGIVGSLGTDAAQGLNGKCAVVSSASGSGFTLQGMDTTGLTYTSGGTFYKVPPARATPITRQDGVYCASGALDHRYLGTICTVASGQTEDSTARRMVYNNNSNIARPLYAVDTTAGWSYAGSGAIRAQNANTTAGVGRCETVIGLSPSALELQNDGYIFASGGGNNAVGVGIDSTNTFSGNQSWTDNTSAGPVSAACKTNLGLGYHFLQRLEVAQATATFGGSNSIYANAGLTGCIFQ